MLLRTWGIRHKTSLYSTIKHSFILYWFIAVDTKPHFTKTSYKKHPLILYWFIAVPFDLLASNLLWCSPEGMRHTVWCKTSFHQNTQPLDFIFICFCKNKWIYLIHNPFVLFHLWCAPEVFDTKPLFTNKLFPWFLYWFIAETHQRNPF